MKKIERDVYGRPLDRLYRARVIETRGKWSLLCEMDIQMNGQIWHNFLIVKTENIIQMHPGATLEVAQTKFNEVVLEDM